MCAQGGERKSARRDKRNDFHFNSDRARVRKRGCVRLSRVGVHALLFFLALQI